MKWTACSSGEWNTKDVRKLKILASRYDERWEEIQQYLFRRSSDDCKRKYRELINADTGLVDPSGLENIRNVIIINIVIN